VANVSRRLIDRPGPYLWDLLRSLSWRVSPIGSRVLSVSGMAPEEAWSMNRTRIAAALHERGLEQIAEPWQQFYLSGWELFLNPDDGDAGRDAIRAAIDALQLSGEFAQVR